MPQSKMNPWKSAVYLLLLVSFVAFNPAQCGAEVKNTQAHPLKRSCKEQHATIPKSSQSADLVDGASRAVDYISEIRPDGLYCWPAAKLPVKVFFQPGNNVSGYKDRFIGCLSSCFDEWTTASNGKLTWVRVEDQNEANVTVKWTNAVTERAEGTEAGRTKTFATLNTATNCGTIHGAEIKLLTRLPEREFSEDELHRAYLHEVGHAFGIAGHSHNPDDIMYYAVTQHASPHLDERDKATINRLYGASGIVSRG